MEEETIEEPMNMNYRESYAWQVGWDKGVKVQKKEHIIDLELIKELLFKGYTDEWIRDRIDERLKELRE